MTTVSTTCVEIDEVRYYESKVGLQCFVTDTDGKSWKIMVKKEMEDWFPSQNLDVTDWELQKNGNV